MIVGIAGKFHAGKDSAADVLVDRYGFTRLSFATALRKECEAVINRRHFPVDMPQDLWNGLMAVPASAVWDKPTIPVIRWFLQWYGTDYRRQQDSEYWVSATADQLGITPGHIVISDVRFQNEAELIRQRAGRLWLVTRQQQRAPEFSQHASELFCDEWTDWDAIIQNDGTVAQLHHRVSDMIRYELDAIA